SKRGTAVARDGGRADDAALHGGGLHRRGAREGRQPPLPEGGRKTGPAAPSLRGAVLVLVDRVRSHALRRSGPRPGAEPPTAYQPEVQPVAGVGDAGIRGRVDSPGDKEALSSRAGLTREAGRGDRSAPVLPICRRSPEGDGRGDAGDRRVPAG